MLEKWEDNETVAVSHAHAVSSHVSSSRPVAGSLLSLSLLTFPFAALGRCQHIDARPDREVHSRLSHKGGAVGEIPEMLSKTTGDVHVSAFLESSGSGSPASFSGR